MLCQDIRSTKCTEGLTEYRTRCHCSTETVMSFDFIRRKTRMCLVWGKQSLTPPCSLALAHIELSLAISVSVVQNPCQRVSHMSQTMGCRSSRTTKSAHTCHIYTNRLDRAREHQLTVDESSGTIRIIKLAGLFASQR